MKNLVSPVWFVFLLSTYLVGCKSVYPPSPSIQMSVSEARKKLVAVIKNPNTTMFSRGSMNAASVTVTIENVKVGKQYFEIVGHIVGEPFLRKHSFDQPPALSYTRTRGDFWILLKEEESRFRLDTLEDAQAFVDALNVLHRNSQNSLDAPARKSDLAAFKERSKAWHLSRQKPPLPEEAERRRILAESALKEKNFEKALEHYQLGLIAEPFWPEGQFNAGILCGELEDYESAADHLRRYLELMPKAPDAKAIQEKIIIFEDKAR